MVPRFLRSGSAAVPHCFRSGSTLPPNFFRSGSALLLNYFRTTSAAVPHFLRTTSAQLPEEWRRPPLCHTLCPLRAPANNGPPGFLLVIFRLPMAGAFQRHGVGGLFVVAPEGPAFSFSNCSSVTHNHTSHRRKWRWGCVLRGLRDGKTSPPHAHGTFGSRVPHTEQRRGPPPLPPPRAPVGQGPRSRRPQTGAI